MKIFSKLLVGILAVIMTATVAFAHAEPVRAADWEPDGVSAYISGEAGSTDELFESGGLINFIKEILEDLDLDSLISFIKEKLAEICEKIFVIIERLLASAMNNEESDGFDQLLFVSNEIETIEAYILDMNAAWMEPGDIPIVYASFISSDDSDPENIKAFIGYVQDNFTLDEAGQMHYAAGVTDFGLFFLTRDDDGICTIREAYFPEEGENYISSLENLCSQSDVSLEDCLSMMEFTEISMIDELAVYYEEHPEITAIEFEGEMYNAEQLREIEQERMTEIINRYQDPME